MDWRKYFTVAVDFVEKAAGKGGKGGKGGLGYNPYRDEKGRFSSHWGGKGFAHATGAKIAGSSSGIAPFHTLKPSEQDSLVRRAISTVALRASSTGRDVTTRGSSTASDITAIISQHTGSLQGKQLSRAVGDSLVRLQNDGLLNVTRVERRGKMEGGHWTYADATTGKRILNPMTGKPMRGSTVRALGVDAKMGFKFNDTITFNIEEIKLFIKKYNEFYISDDSYIGSVVPKKFRVFYKDYVYKSSYGTYTPIISANVWKPKISLCIDTYDYGSIDFGFSINTKKCCESGRPSPSRNKVLTEYDYAVMMEMGIFITETIFEPELTIQQAIDTLDLNVTNRFDWEWISK